VRKRLPDTILRALQPAELRRLALVKKRKEKRGTDKGI
jgi:hypothetical protein